MSQHRLSDLRMVLKGLQKVVRSSLSKQETECSLKWQTSSLKPIIDEILHKLEKSANETCENKQHIAEKIVSKGRISAEKASMIAEGIQQFMKYSAQNRTFVEVTQEPSPQDTSGTPEWARSILFEADMLRESDENIKTGYKLARTAHYAMYSSSLSNAEVRASSPQILKGREENIDGGDQSSTKPNSIPITQNILPKSEECTSHNPVSRTVSVSHNSSLQNDFQNAFTTSIPTQNLMLDKIHVEPPVSNQTHSSSVTEKLGHVQQLSEKSKERKVPSSQIGRLVQFGGLAAGLGIGALAEVTRKTIGFGQEKSSDNTSYSNVILNDANAERIVNTLCRVRGAALKIGQMLSIQDDSIMSPRLQKAFERVRQSADFMPSWQAEKVLREELGDDWKSKVASFESRPFAAASIGQVHLAVLHDGRKVAVKIQYPGVANSIDSDIKNLMSTLKVWNVLPEGVFIDHLMNAARRELALEVDYHYEASCGKKFKELLQPFPQYFVPEVIDELSTKRVLTTELIDGFALDKCFNMDQETRNKIATGILHLCLMELCIFKLMQTDPNWSNFFYNPTTGRISLLDFGATRQYSEMFVDKYLRVIMAAVSRDKELILKTSLDLGMLTGFESKIMQNAHVEGVLILGEAFSYDGEFDFGTQDTIKRIEKIIPIMIEHRLTPPPEEIYSLHRKLAGIFLLFTKLRAKMNCKMYFDRIYSQYKLEK